MQGALARAEDLNLKNCVISGDCKQVVSDISKGTLGAHGAIITEIRAKATLFNSVFIFEGRAVNYEAHRLARFFLSQGTGRHVWFGTPHDPRCIPQHVDFGDE